MKQVTVTCFSEFIKQTDIFNLAVDLVIFRGQHEKGNLLPSVARKNPEEDTSSKEKQVLKQLKLQGACLLPETVLTDLDLLVRAQHYGLKTRLLDWTGNPLVALWFACSDKKKGDVYVYALMADGLLGTWDDPFSNSKTSVFQPRLNNARIVAQQGWFTLHSYETNENKFVPLDKIPEMKESLCEYCIPGKNRLDILNSLAAHGVSAKTIYPDLDGLCRYLNWKNGLVLEDYLADGK